MSKEKVQLKYIRIPEYFTDIDDEFINKLVRSLYLDIDIKNWISKTKAAYPNKDKFIKKRIYLNSETIEMINKIKQEFNLSFEDVACSAMFKFKEIFPGKLDPYNYAS